MKLVPTPLRRQGGGYAAEGPGFYVWDRDLTELARWAGELREVSGPAPKGSPLPGLDEPPTSADRRRRR